MTNEEVLQIIEEAARDGGETLYLNFQGITSLPPEIGNFTNLQNLDLRGSRITSLPSEIGNLTNLQYLNLSGNSITSLPSEIGNLISLQTLELSGNSITSLPSEIGNLTDLRTLNLHDNPLPIPPEILEEYRNPAGIIDYYFRLQTEESRPLNEAKMLIVGQGGVGKTSLLKALLKGDQYIPESDFKRDEGKTEGIDVHHLQVQSGEAEIQLNVWDFGGQEIYHATHQFFLTHRSLYLVVLDGRQSEQERNLDYWLKIIQSFGGNSPVIVVANRCDEHELDLDWADFQRKYPNIKEFVKRVSCKTAEGLQELASTIQREVNSLEHIHDRLPASWFDIKDQLVDMDEDFITYDEYRKLCVDQGIDFENSQKTLIGFLHDLGVVLHFHDHPILDDTNILNPEWVTKAVYQILNSNDLFHNNGVLDIHDMPNILDGGAYPSDRYPYITQMMRLFELCFSFPDVPNERFLIPDLLHREAKYTGDWDGGLGFQFHYDVLPSSVISRFIVRKNSFVHENTYWRNGVVLSSEGKNNLALVRADLAENRIFIHVNGNEATRREFLGSIRDELREIHSTIRGIRVEPRVPIPDTNVTVSYEHLLTLESKGIESYIPEGLEDEVQVKPLLNGIETERRGQEHQEGEPFDDRRNTRPQPPAPETQAARQGNPWKSGLFYLVAFLAIIITAALIGTYASWVALPFILIGGILGLCAISFLQLKNDQNVGEDAFLKLMLGLFKQLRLINPDKQSSS